ncbi:hypothetical protein KKH13_04830 [Patescibacteria group bacterium]|uniref:Glycosyltransferase n=1 Tax=viral metagenome TaxID=1070528 RepID=A0A6M3KYV8_9ZZZZ|nr:hypothetical protein [Patescibacteria group bacterium]
MAIEEAKVEERAIVVEEAIPVVEKPVPKVLIGVPILSWTHEFATSFLRFWTDLMTCHYEGVKFHVGYEFAYRRPVHMAEEDLAQKAIDSGCTHLLLMDDDIYDITSKDFVTLLQADKDVVGGIMHASGFPYAMCAFRRYDLDASVAEQPILKGPARLYEIPPEQRVGLQKVDLIPFAFTLIKTEALKKLKRPWFTCNNQAPTDSWFADSVLTGGMEYYAHFDVWLNHRGVHRDNQNLWVQMGMVESKRTGSNTIVELTPEDMKRHEVMMRMKLEDAEKRSKENCLGKMKFFSKEVEGVGTPV